MIQTYKSSDGGKVKVFFIVDNDGNISSIEVGNRVVPMGTGFQFYVDNYVAEQIDKCELYFEGFTPSLRLREGETLDVPKKTEKELEIERLKYELEKLQSEDDRPQNAE